MVNFRATYIPNKFWYRRSLDVPFDRIVVDENFKNLNDLFANHDYRESFEIFWIEKGVMGNVMLPGELNYAYVDGKFYHLEKVSNQGFFDNGGHEENLWGYYMEYDDWQNDWLTNNVHLYGTICKTGDYRLINKYIIQVPPLVHSYTGLEFFTSGEQQEETERNIIVGDLRWEIDYIYTPEDLNKFNALLATVVSTPPDRTKLTIPIALHKTPVRMGESFIVTKIIEFLKRRDLAVYDVKKNVINFAGFKTKYKINQVFCISAREYHTFEIAQSENQHARVKDTINLQGLQPDQIEYLTTDLIPFEDQKQTSFNTLVEKYLAKYPNITSTLDKSIFKQIAYEEIYSTFGESLFIKDSDTSGIEKNLDIKNVNPERVETNWQDESPVISFNWSELGGIKVFLNERNKSINGIYQPGTDSGDILFLTKLSDEYKTKMDDITAQDGTIDPYKHLAPKRTAAAWWDSNNTDLIAWLATLNYYSLASYDYHIINSECSDLGREKSTLTGNMAMHYKLINRNIYDNTILTLPDYKTNSWVLAEVVQNSFNKNIKFLYSEGKTYFPQCDRQLFSSIFEIGRVNQSKQLDWMHPLTDKILKNNNKGWSKYAFIIPLMIRWRWGYTPGLDSYGYKFKYAFTENRWKKIEGENKRLNVMFQFPLSGCGFDIYELLKEYKDLNDRYLRWNFICSDEMKEKNGWEDKGGTFDGYFGIKPDSSNTPKAVHELPKKQHNAFNEIIEIRIYTGAKASAERVFNLLFRLWVYYFGWRWDGSYNGAVLFRNYGSEEGNGFLEIDWAKPFNRQWYVCTIYISNFYGDGIGANNGQLTYGSGSRTWNAKQQVWSVGYKFANNMTGVNKDIKEILSCNVNSIDIRINTDGTFKNIRSFNTDQIPPIDFSHLFLGDRPWENIKFIIRRPSGSPFDSYTLGSRLADIVRDMTYTTHRTFNPTKFEPFSFRRIDCVRLDDYIEGLNNYEKGINGEIISFDSLKLKIPYYIFRALDPDQLTSKFRNLRFTGSNEDAFREFRKLLKIELHNALTVLSARPFIFDLVGTEFICVAKINPLGVWEIELLSKTNESIETVETKKYIFNNHRRYTREGWLYGNYETISRINSQWEVVAWGQRFPLKWRPIFWEDEKFREIRVKVTPINDPKQTTTSLWYMVEIKTPQDYHRTRVEVPKELTAMNIERPYERENILRMMAYHAKDRELENIQHKEEIKKYSFDIGVRGQRLDINRSREITGEMVGMAQTALQTAQGMGLGSILTGGAAMAGAAGAASMAGQAANMVFSKQLYDLSKEEHMVHAAYGERALQIKEEQIRNRHEIAQQSERMSIYNMQTNVSYPSNSDALIFREENKQFNLPDIYLVRYTNELDPQYTLLVDYYYEHGYEVIIPQQYCYGINSMNLHLKFSRIIHNAYPVETIRRMIEERAMNGIRIVLNKIYTNINDSYYINKEDWDKRVFPDEVIEREGSVRTIGFVGDRLETIDFDHYDGDS